MAIRRSIRQAAWVLLGATCISCTAPEGREGLSSSAGSPDSAGTTAPDPQEAANRAFELRMAGRVDEARRVLDVALTQNSGRAAVWFESARLHFYMCEFDRAEAAIDQAIRQDPRNARYHVWDGQVAVYNAVWKAHQFLGVLALPAQMAKARRAYERAIEADKNLDEARLELIHLYLQQPGRDGGRARKHAEVLAAKDPVLAARARSTLLGNQGIEEQLSLWKRVAAEHPERADAHVGLAKAYRLVGRFGDARDEYAQALSLEPTDSHLLFEIAYCHQNRKEWDEQARTYEQYLALEPPGPLPSRLRAMRYLATVERTRGHVERAEELQTEANRLDPRYGKRGAVRDDVRDLFTRP